MTNAAALTVVDLFVYPVKALRAVRVSSAKLTDRGLLHDRRFMIVDGEAAFVTQRTEPRLALVGATFDGEVLVLRAGDREVRVTRPGDDATHRDVRVWDDVVRAAFASDEAGAFLSDFIGRELHLVFLPESSRRQVRQDYARPDDQVSFADGFPLLLTTEESLDELNRRIDGDDLPMDRFRPNVVVRGARAFEEDRWSRIAIGGVPFRVPKRCDRCSVTTVDQATGARGKEPLATLATFRREGSSVYFGQNLIHEALGALDVGATLEVLETRS